MSTREARRDAAIEKMAEHVLSAGLAGATLRPLAAAAGTSDRMLLYYFADRDEVLTAVLERIAAKLLHDLDEAIPIASPRPYAVFVHEVSTLLGSEGHRRYMNVWLDLVAGAARDMQPHRRVAGTIADIYLSWVTQRLEPQSDTSLPGLAPLFLVAIEGMYLLQAAGRPVLAEQAIDQLTIWSRGNAEPPSKKM